ncbi:MAG: HEPN domain-containing protein [Anaerolineae bacterium]|nr:HEPN domain-containing protein [Anaerolineae bacterium]
MRKREEVIRDFVQQWLEKAEGDLAAAEILAQAEIPDHFPCAFHCQQAAEKFLKATLVYHQIEFRKTHDLARLLELASQADPGLQVELAACNWLTPFGIEFRYPGEYPAVDHSTAQEALAEAKRVKRTILERLAPDLRAFS